MSAYLKNQVGNVVAHLGISKMSVIGWVYGGRFKKKNIFMPKLNPNIAFDPIALGPLASITSSEDCTALFQGKKGGLFCQSRVRLPRVCRSLPVV